MIASVPHRIIIYIMYNVQDYIVLCNKDVQPAICEGYIFLTCWKQLHDRIISLKTGGLGPKTRLTQPLFIEVSVRGKGEVMLGVSIMTLSTIFLLNFGTVPDSMVFFCFSFIYSLIFFQNKSKGPSWPWSYDSWIL